MGILVNRKGEYLGEILTRCLPLGLDFRRAFAVVVSGMTLNPCGHLLLNVGGRGGTYCHVVEPRGYPRYMDEVGFMRYLTTHRKRELRRAFLPVVYPDRALAKMEDLLSRPWSWWVLPHNCVTFVEEVLQAGGSTAGLYTNCPRLESFR
jgi:hypothetical protein